MLVDLLRHGTCEGGARLRGGGTDDALTDEGWRQMEAATAAAGPWDRIVTSPLRRCAEFARRLAGRTGAAIHTEPGFAEIGLGRWEGRAVETLAGDARYARFLDDPAAQGPPDGEPWEAFRARVLAAWEALVDAGDERVLVVTHGGPIRIVLGAVLELPDRALLRLEVPQGCRTRLRCGVDGDGRRWASLMAHVPPELVCSAQAGTVGSSRR